MVSGKIGRLSASAALAFGLLLGCEGAVSAEDPGSAKIEPRLVGGAKLQGDDWSLVPVPAEDGPKLAPLRLTVAVKSKPEPTAPVVGVLRLGARVARSKEPVTQRECAGGWYAVRPYGFVCAGKEATTQLDHPIVRAIQAEPDRSKAMPYKYAFVRATAPNYLRIPTKDEQFKYELRLERHLRNWRKLQEEWDALDVGANDVPLDDRGLAIGKIPEHARPMDQSERYGGNGDDRTPWWLVGERKIPNISSFKAPAYAVIADRVRRHAGIALIGTFVAGEEAQSRRFAISTDARLIPADKLKADSGSPFHGYEIRDVGLPVAFARHARAAFYRLENGNLKQDQKAGWREFVPLTGTVRQIDGRRMVETRDGRWMQSEQIRTIAKPSSLPSWARKGNRWIDLSLVQQTLTLWEGDVPVYVTLISTGRDGMGDPGKTMSTPQGTFRVYQKHITTTMDSNEADNEFELRDVPWVMYFKGGYALHGAYWHDDFGRPRSHGCVNLAPIDARYVFHFSSPSVPEHWQAAYAGEATEQGTLIHIRP